MENPFEIIIERLNSIENFLIELARIQNPVFSNQVIQEEFMTVSSLGQYLDISVSTIYQLTCKKEIPYCKKGKRLYFNKKEINEWICQGRMKTIYEIEQEAQKYILNHPRRR